MFDPNKFKKVIDLQMSIFLRMKLTIMFHCPLLINFRGLASLLARGSAMSQGNISTITLGNEGVASVRCAPSSEWVLTTTWGGSVVMHNLETSEQVAEIKFNDPILGSAFTGTDTLAAVGGLNNRVHLVDFKSNTLTELGTHDDTISAVNYCQELSTVVTGGWDGYVKQWDVRLANQKPTSKLTAPGCRVYTADVHGHMLVVGLNKRLFHLYDLRRMDTPAQIRDGLLLDQTRRVRFTLDGTRYVISSIEGRAAVEVVDPSTMAQKNKFAFKCHRTTTEGKEVLHPVNGLAIHPVHGTLATGGSDSTVCTWDLVARKKLTTLPPLPSSVIDLDYSASGTHLVIGSGYGWEHGEEGVKGTLTGQVKSQSGKVETHGSGNLKTTDILTVVKVSDAQVKPKG